MSASNWINDWNFFLQTQPILQLKNTAIRLEIPQKPINEIAADERFWKKVQSFFPKPTDHINLNNGGVSSNPIHVEKAFLTYYSLLNTSPSYFTWKVMEAGRSAIKQGLAEMINAKENEIAIFRNATEALNNAIFGIPLEAGDEVVACTQDYIKCVASWKQRELRDKIKITWIEITGKETNQEVIEKYLSAFSSSTKVLHLTHLINWNGQILPVEQICYEAKKRGITVIVDAAHSFAVIETDVRKLNCDYMAVALHKWLSGPIAAGMLFVKKEIIPLTYPLASAFDPLSDQITKFEEMSIQVLPNLLALGYALEFHFLLGRELKEARLTYLRKRWTTALENEPAITFNVPLNEVQCKAIVNFNVTGRDSLDIEQELFETAKIHVTAFNRPTMKGIRITPNIYTPLSDIDTFIETMKNLIQ